MDPNDRLTMCDKKVDILPARFIEKRNSKGFCPGYFLYRSELTRISQEFRSRYVNVFSFVYFNLHMKQQMIIKHSLVGQKHSLQHGKLYLNKLA